MGLFDSLKNAAGSALRKEATKAVSGAVNSAVQSVGKGRNHSETFTFTQLPTTVAELQGLPEASLDSAYKTAALVMAVLCHYEQNPNACFEMLNFLKGPEPLNGFQQQFINERLQGKAYIPRSHFNGATPENNYQPTQPYTIVVSENPYSFDNENWGVMWVKSSGSDSPRQIKLRKKPSTGQWFLNEIQCLSEIRTPVEADPWA